MKNRELNPRKRGMVSKVLMVLFIITTAALLGTTIWLGIWTYQLNTTVNYNNQQTENMYEEALYSAADSLSSIENSIAKLTVTRSKTHAVSYATELSRTAASAASATSHLPVSMDESMKIEKFLNQVSDFSASYAKVAASGGDTEKYDEMLPEIYKTVRTLKGKMLDITNNLGADYRITDLIEHEGDFFSGGSIGDSDTESSVEFPTLIYDGPFSDALDEKNFKSTEGLSEISEDDAMRIANEKMGLTSSKVTGTVGEGKALIYVVNGELDGHDAYVGVTKRGGIVIESEIYQEPASAKYDEEYAKQFAAEAMKSLGYSNDIEPVWYNEINGIAYVNLVPIVDNVVYYTDLVIVKVNLGTGKLAGFEARGYCSNHISREPYGVVMNKNAVANHISSKLKIESVRLALIPKGENEILCYEVKSKTEGLDFFIYLDAKTGDEVEIMRVIDADQGSMIY